MNLRTVLDADFRLQRQDLFALCVEVDAAPLLIRKIPEVRGLCRAMADEYVSVRPLAGLNAFEKIADVLLGQRVSRVRDLRCLNHLGGRLAALRRVLRTRTSNPEPAFGSAHLDPFPRNARG